MKGKVKTKLKKLTVKLNRNDQMKLKRGKSSLFGTSGNNSGNNHQTLFHLQPFQHMSCSSWCSFWINSVVSAPCAGFRVDLVLFLLRMFVLGANSLSLLDFQLFSSQILTLWVWEPCGKQMRSGRNWVYLLKKAKTSRNLEGWEGKRWRREEIWKNVFLGKPGWLGCLPAARDLRRIKDFYSQ